MPPPVKPSALALTGSMCLLVSAIFVIIAFASPYWASYEDVSMGLWKRGVCGQGAGCWFVDQTIMRTLDWINAVRALVAISIVLLGLMIVCIPVYLYVSIGLFYRAAMAVAAVCSSFSAILIFIAVIVYGAKASQLGWSLHWCFVISIIGGIFSVFAAIIFIVCVFMKKPNFKEHYEKKVIKLQDQMHVYVVQDNPAFYSMS